MANDRPFDGQVVLVTGTSRGIGRYLAEFFLARGARVVGMSRGPGGWKREGYEHHVLDVADEGGVARLVQDLARRLGRLDVVVNNAGVAAMNPALLTPASGVEALFRTNFLGTFVVCREAGKVMCRRRYGRIVNLGSVAVPMQVEGESAYAGSKAAVVAFTQILARELAPFNVTCNVVAPGPVETDLTAPVPKDKIGALVNRLAIKRLGRYEDVANAVEFFARPESSYVTGQVMYLGGV